MYYYTNPSSSCFILVYSSLVIVSSPEGRRGEGRREGRRGRESIIVKYCKVIPSRSLLSFWRGSSKSGLGGAGGIYTSETKLNDINTRTILTIAPPPAGQPILQTFPLLSAPPTHKISCICLVLYVLVVKPYELLVLPHNREIAFLESL